MLRESASRAEVLIATPPFRYSAAKILKIDENDRSTRKLTILDVSSRRSVLSKINLYILYILAERNIFLFQYHNYYSTLMVNYSYFYIFRHKEINNDYNK